MKKSMAHKHTYKNINSPLSHIYHYDYIIFPRRIPSSITAEIKRHLKIFSFINFMNYYNSLCYQSRKGMVSYTFSSLHAPKNLKQLHIQSSAVITRSNFIILHTTLRLLQQSLNQTWNSQQTPIPHTKRWAMGCLLCRYWKKIACVIMAPRCISNAIMLVPFK